MYRAYLMRDQVGEQFPGTVSAVTSFGAFVELDEPFVEGLIKLDSLGEPFEYDEVHMRLSGKRTGMSIELGDKVTVEINNVSVIRRRIDFTLVQAAQRKTRAPRVEANPRTSVPQKKRAGREVERAQLGRGDRASQAGGKRGAAKAGAGGKMQLGVSHRGIAASSSSRGLAKGKGKGGGGGRGKSRGKGR